MQNEIDLCLLYEFLRGIRIAVGYLVCVFMWYPYSCGTFCMHFYAVSAYLWGHLCVFLRGIHISLGQFVCVFMWYPQTYGAICMHFYVVSAYLWGNIYTFLRRIRILVPGASWVSPGCSWVHSGCRPVPFIKNEFSS